METTVHIDDVDVDAAAGSSTKLYKIFVLMCCLFMFLKGKHMAYDKDSLINLREGEDDHCTQQTVKLMDKFSLMSNF